MNTPWIEIFSNERSQAYGSEYAEEFPWHALFACQVVVRPFDVLQKLKWGFNSAVLMEEALDRLKLFIESQYAINSQYRIERPERRTLALRCINVPGAGLQVGLVVKVCAKAPREAREVATIYWREIYSLFPYDHALIPALTEDEYHRLAGTQILMSNTPAESISQIKRYETPLSGAPNQVPVLGIWQAGPRSDEQIWRTLVALPFAAMLNISLRPTVLYDQERTNLLKLKQKLAKIEGEQLNITNNTIHKGWVEPFLNRRLAPWGKFYYLQVHIVTQDGAIDESLTRAVGTSLTRPNGDKLSPGFETAEPANPTEAKEWKTHLRQLEIIRSSSEYSIPRLHEIADLDEAWSIFRFPYPPENGWPDVTLLKSIRNEQP